MSPCPSPAVLQDLLSDRLSPTEEGSLEEHVSTCANCQQVLEQLTAAVPPQLIQPTMIEERRFRPDRALLLGARVVSSPSAEPPREPEVVPARPLFPDYHLLNELGRGGMGVVYRARQHRLNRIVALKVLLAKPQVGLEDHARFQAEAEALARLQHPNIVQIFDFGVSADQPYLALEYVDGGSLADKIQAQPQPSRQAAELVETLARASQAAHACGVVHRDLKPSNILLASGGGTPWHPKIADFGLAKLQDRATDLTRSGDILGTPNYMAPEQARGLRRIGPAADVYALGAILYKLLTGRPPFEAESTYDTVLQVAHDDPLPPSRLLRQLPRDLETICLKCLQKEPAHRYASAQALAEDLRRFLNGEPILARPTTLWQRSAKWARRRPVLAALLGLLICLLAFSIGSLSVAVIEARRSERLEVERRKQAEDAGTTEAALRRDAETEQRRAERLAARTLLDLAYSQCKEGSVDRGLHTLFGVLERAQLLADPDLDYAARVNLAAWRPAYLALRGTVRHKDQVLAVACSQDGRRVATGSLDQTARVWDAQTGAPLTPPLLHAAPVSTVAFSPDGNTLLTGCGGAVQEARLWDTSTGKPRHPGLKHDAAVLTVAFAADGQRFLTLSERQVQLWDAAEAKPIGDPLRQTGPIRSAVFSPDGHTVATGSADGTVELWRSETGAALGIAMRPRGPVMAVTFSPDGHILLTGTGSGEARLWHAATGKPLSPPLVHQGPILAVAFSPDGRTALTGGALPGSSANMPARGEARLWRAAPDHPKVGEQLGPLLEHPASVASLAFSPSGRTIITGAFDANVRVWLAATGQLLASSEQKGGDLRRTEQIEGAVRQIALSKDGRTLLTASAGNTGTGAAGRIWEALPEPDLVPLRGLDWVRCVDLARDERLALTSEHAPRQLVLWDVASARPLGTPIPCQTGTLAPALFGPDGRTIFTGTLLANRSGELRCWDRTTGKTVLGPIALSAEISALGVSPDGRWLLTGTSRGTIQRWSTDRLLPSYTVDQPQLISALRFSPDGRIFLSTSKDGLVRLWEAPTGQLLHTWPHPAWVDSAVFSADGRYCLTACRDGLARLWGVATGKLQGTPLVHHVDVHCVGFHADGRSLFTSTHAGQLQRWDIAFRCPLGPPVQFATSIHEFVSGPHSQLLIREDREIPDRQRALGTTAYLYRAPLAVAGDAARVKLSVEVLTGMAMDDSAALRLLSAKERQARRQELERQGGCVFSRASSPEAARP